MTDSHSRAMRRSTGAPQHLAPIRRSPRAWVGVFSGSSGDADRHSSSRERGIRIGEAVVNSVKVALQTNFVDTSSFMSKTENV